MSKRAEQRGLEAVPPRWRKTKDGKGKVDSALPVRKFYIRAYERAEKDIVEHCEKRIAEYNADNLSNMFLRRAFEDVIRFIKDIPYKDYSDE